MYVYDTEGNVLTSNGTGTSQAQPSVIRDFVQSKAESMSSMDWHYFKVFEMCIRDRSLYSKADFLLDLHGGGLHETMTPFVFFPVGAGKEIEELTRKAAQKLSLSYMVQSDAKDGLYSWATQRGVPAVPVSYTHLDVYKRQVYHRTNEA